MGNSLFGKLKSVMSRQKTSDIATQASDTGAEFNLSRIGMTSNSTVAPEAIAIAETNNTQDVNSVTDAQITTPNSSETLADVGIQFFAEVPHQQCAEEIVSVSQRAKNCISAQAQPVDEDIWSVAITLSMTPIPQQIHDVETVLQMWAEKFGGSSKGWGLSQSQAA